MKNKLLLLIILFVSSIYGQNPTRFPYGVQVTGGQPENTTPTYLTTTSTTGLQEKIPSAYIEKTANKTSSISGYDTSLYPNEKATHDALDLKLNISDLPTNLTLYPTTAASDVSGYVKMVTDIQAPDYNTVAVDISTPTITTTDQLVASLITDAGVLIGQPGIFNATTFGNIRRLSGSGTATFYFKVFHRDSTGTETLIGTSSNTEVITSSSYLEFTGALLWDDGDFIDTDRIVIKYYANRIAGSSDPVYQFQFGGATPVRTLLPVPFSVVDAGYELKANKQNSLAIDGTGTKYPTVDAVNAVDLQKVVNVGGYAELGDPNSSVEFTSSVDDITDREINFFIGDGAINNGFQLNSLRATISSEDSLNSKYANINAENQNIQLYVRDGISNTEVTFNTPVAITSLNFPAKTIAGDYTLATTDEISTLDSNVVHKNGDETIEGFKTFQNGQVIIYGGASNPLYIQANNVGAYIENLSANDALKIENTSSGDALNINGTTASTGKILKVTNNNVETLNITKEGNVTANSFIKTGGTSTQALMANGNAVQLVTQTITNGVTDKSPSEDAVYDALALKVSGSGTTNYVPKFTAGGTIGNSQIFDNGTNVGIGTGTPTAKLSIKSTSYPVLDITRDSGISGDAIFGVARFERLTTTPTTDGGLGFFFNYPNSASQSTFCGLFGGYLSDITPGAEVGNVVFAASWRNLSPANNKHLIIRATGTSTGNVLVPNGKLLVATSIDDGITTNVVQVNGNITSNVATLSNQVVVKSQLDAIRPYKIYTALMTQSGTSAPVATVLENTLGGTVVWTRTSSGSYVGTLAGAFVTNKTVILYNASSSSFSSFVTLNTSNNTIDWQNGSDDRMLNNGTMIEIRVYN